MNIPFQWLFAQFGGWSFSIAESHASRDKSPCFCVWLRYLDAIKTCAFRLPCHIPAGGGYGPDGKGSLVIQHGWRIIEDQITWTTQHLFFSVLNLQQVQIIQMAPFPMCEVNKGIVATMGAAGVRNLGCATDYRWWIVDDGYGTMNAA